MSDAFSYPGVYIVEAPSSVHTIIGVPTAITAFVGAAARGPLNEPVAIQSASDYQRRFGGDGSKPLDQAINLFFMNGGASAIVVRVGPSDLASAKATIGATPVVAASPGAWGANISYSVDQNGLTTAQQATLYNLQVTYRRSPNDPSPTTENYSRVSTDPTSPRSLPRLLANSQLLALDPSPPASPPAASSAKGKAAAQPAEDGAADAPASPAAATGGAMPPVGGPTALSGAPANDPASTEADLYTAGDDQVGFMAVAKHNTFFNLLVLTPVAGEDVAPETLGAAADFARSHRAMLVADAPSAWGTVDAAVQGRDDFFTKFGAGRDNAAVYFPRLTLTDTSGNELDGVGPAGAIAGLYAATDATRGVWKAPAGIAAQLSGISDLSIRMSDFDNGRLNPVAVNCLRSLPIVGDVVWGARTMNGDDLSASQWKYVPIRRLALFIEESLYRGTQWVVFEPNDEPLWASVRLNVGAFMHTLFRQGAFQGQTAKEAYFVKCDSDTNPQADIDRGILNVVVGFAPLKPAEFVVVTIQQITGDIQV